MVTAFSLRRRAVASYRTFAVAVLIYACTIATAVAISEPAFSTLNRVVYASATRSAPSEFQSFGPDGASTQGDWREWLERRRTRGEQTVSRRTPPRTISAGSIVLGVMTVPFVYTIYLTPYALFGVVLARLRPWAIPLVVAGLGATSLLLQVLMIGMMGEHATTYAVWRQLAAGAGTAAIWLAFMAASERAARRGPAEAGHYDYFCVSTPGRCTSYGAPVPEEPRKSLVPSGSVRSRPLARFDPSFD